LLERKKETRDKAKGCAKVASLKEKKKKRIKESFAPGNDFRATKHGQCLAKDLFIEKVT